MNAHVMTSSDTELAAEIQPPCESKGHLGAEWAVWVFCEHCGTTLHLLCASHRNRMHRRPGRLWVHPPCGTPDTRYLHSERI